MTKLLYVDTSTLTNLANAFGALSGKVGLITPGNPEQQATISNAVSKLNQYLNALAKSQGCDGIAITDRVRDESIGASEKYMKDATVKEYIQDYSPKIVSTSIPGEIQAGTLPTANSGEVSIQEAVRSDAAAGGTPKILCDDRFPFASDVPAPVSTVEGLNNALSSGQLAASDYASVRDGLNANVATVTDKANLIQDDAKLGVVQSVDPATGAVEYYPPESVPSNVIATTPNTASEVVANASKPNALESAEATFGETVGTSSSSSALEGLADGASKALGVLGAGVLAYDVLTSSAKAAEQLQAGNSAGAQQTMADLAGRVAGGYAGAVIGSALGPVGALVGGAIGSVIGQGIAEGKSPSQIAQDLLHMGGSILNAAASMIAPTFSTPPYLAGPLGGPLGSPPGGSPTTPRSPQPSLGGPPSSPPYYEPLVLNLTGGALTTSINSGVVFDVNNTGFSIATGWAAPGQGILVYDPSGGNISNGSQLFGTSMKLANGTYALNGFQALAQYDANGDGAIDASDPAWSSLRIWVNSNGSPGSGQLLTLTQAGISSIKLSSTTSNITDAQGNQILSTGTFTWASGGTGQMADVSFQTNPTLSVPDTTVTVSSEILALPDLQGYGKVASLHQAMALDSTGMLKGLVEQFVAASTDAQRDSLVDQIIEQWAGTASVSPDSRGTYLDARELGALEAFVGQIYTDPTTGNSNPSSAAAAVVVQVAYSQYHDEVYAGLMARTVLAPLFSGMQAAFDLNSGTLYWDYSSAQATIASDLTSNRSSALTLLSEFNRSVHALGLDTGEGYFSFRSTLAALGPDVAATFPYGTPIVQGTAGNDAITAWAGNQTVYGNGGNDTLIGGGANETLIGGGGNTTFIGGTGNNESFIGGSRGSDTFIAGHGTEYFQENAYAKSTFIYNQGDGQLNIRVFAAFSNSIDTLQLGAGLTASNVFLNSGNGSSDLFISDGVAGDQIDLINQFWYSGGAVKVLEFADGTTLSLGNGLTIRGSAANSVLYGSTQGGTTFIAGVGSETLYGRGGRMPFPMPLVMDR